MLQLGSNLFWQNILFPVSSLKINSKWNWLYQRCGLNTGTVCYKGASLSSVLQLFVGFSYCTWFTAVPPVFNPFSQFIPQLDLYSQLQLSLWSDPIAFSVPKSTWCVLVKIQGDGNLDETQMKKWWKFEHFLTSRTKWKLTLKTLNGYFR